MKGIKANSEEKDTQIGELKRQVDAGKRNVKRLEDDLEDIKQVLNHLILKKIMSDAVMLEFLVLVSKVLFV